MKENAENRTNETKIPEGLTEDFFEDSQATSEIFENPTEDSNLEVIENAGTSDNSNKNKSIQEKATEIAGNAVEGAGIATQAAGKSVRVAGATTQAAGKGAEIAGKGMQAAGSGVRAAGSGISNAGAKLTEAGGELSGTGYGAIVGVPLAIVGAATTAAGKATEVAGAATEKAGKATEKAGQAANKAGKKVSDAGKKIDDAGKKRRKHGQDIKALGRHQGNYRNKNQPNSINKLKNKRENFKNKLKERKNKLDSSNRTRNKRESEDEEAKKLLLKFPKILKILIIALIVLLPTIMFIFLIVMISWLIEEDGTDASAAGAVSGYYAVQCNDVTVIFTDKNNNYDVTGSGTYSLEEYVAGVIAGEVGEFNNLEVYKEYAIAARTYFLKNETNCTMESSDRKQVFKETTNSLAKQAAEETKGQVLLDANGMLMLTEYDAFCSIDIDDEYYTIKQKNQRIPIEWVERQSGILQEWKQGTCAGNHGRGSSQWGSYYLATERNYDYKQLLNYYYGTSGTNEESGSVSISNPSFISSVAGLDIKETRNASYQLSQSIDTFLSSKGSSLADYNNFIKKSVTEAGVGTREGVVTAAVSMINYLYDNFSTKLPYYWGGASQDIGIPSSFGKNIPSSPSVSGKVYQYKSFDCSGFVSWAIKNGGYKFSRLTTYYFDQNYSSDSCTITDSSCKGQPGDLINSKSIHVKMIVSVDEANNRYFVAESTTNGVIIQTHGMHTSMSSSEPTKILHMDNFYNNKNNVDPNY